MTPLARKYDFTQIVNLSANIPDQKVSVSVQDGERYNFVNLLPEALVTAMRVVVSKNPMPWSSNTAYTAGQICVHAHDQVDYVWQCVTGNTGSEPTPANANWSKSELGTYWYNHVRRWIVYKTYSEMLALQGAEFTQFGLVLPRESESEPVGGSMRGGMINIYKNRAYTEQNSALRVLHDVRGIFDGTSYGLPSSCRPKKTFGITAI